MRITRPLASSWRQILRGEWDKAWHLQPWQLLFRAAVMGCVRQLQQKGDEVRAGKKDFSPDGGLLPALRKGKLTRCERQKLFHQLATDLGEMTLNQVDNQVTAPPPPVPALLSNQRTPVTTML